MDATNKAPDYLKDDHLSVGTKEYLKVLNASNTPVESLSPADARNVLVSAQAGVDVDLSGIDESEKTITVDEQTIKLNIVRPAGKNEKLPVFIFVHGGGWVLGDYPTHKRLVRDIVVESGFAAVFVNYTPSPEAKYPKAINQIYAATKWVAENGDEINVDGKTLGIVGNSVGGNMSLVTSIMAKEQNGPDIKVQVLMWPVTDATFDWGSWKEYGEQRFLTSSLMKWMFDNYTTDEDERKDIHLSPLRATVDQLKGLPPTLIEVAENDILRDEGEAMGRKLDEAGVPTTTIRFNGVTHDWGLLNGFAKLSPVRSLGMFTGAFLKNYLIPGEEGVAIKGDTNYSKETAGAGAVAGTAAAAGMMNDKDKFSADQPKDKYMDDIPKTSGCGCHAKQADTDKYADMNKNRDDDQMNTKNNLMNDSSMNDQYTDDMRGTDDLDGTVSYSEIIIIEELDDDVDNMDNTDNVDYKNNISSSATANNSNMDYNDKKDNIGGTCKG